MALSAKNRRFWAKTKAEQRIAIAKDILARIEDKKIKPKTRMYLKVKRIGLDVEEATPLDKVINEAEFCTACALGSCFLSLVTLGDRVTMEDALIDLDENDRPLRDDAWRAKTLKANLRRKNIYIDDDNMRPYLRKVFSPRQLSLIESAFEKDEYTLELRNDGMKYEDAVDTVCSASGWGREFPTARKRLIAIMESIISNKGTFKPVPIK